MNKKEKEAITPGALKRQKAEEEKEKAKLLEKHQKEVNKKIESITSTINGSYKQVVLDNYAKQFAHNYGDEVNLKTLSDCFKFESSIKQNMVIPSFSFDNNKVEFKSDIRRRLGKFNENTFSNFISNQEEISGEIISPYNFLNNREEGEGFTQQKFLEDPNNIKIKQELPQFNPTSSSEERYGEFNRINKLRGYSPIESTVQEANKNIELIWRNDSKKAIERALKS